MLRAPCGAPVRLSTSSSIRRWALKPIISRRKPLRRSSPAGHGGSWCLRSLLGPWLVLTFATKPYRDLRSPPRWISGPPPPNSWRSLRRATYPPLLHHSLGHDPWVGSGLLPSTGITRPQRYTNSSAICVRRRWPSRVRRWRGVVCPLLRSQTSIVPHCSCPVRAAITTPVGSPVAYLARFTGDVDLHRCSGGSAPTLTLSKPAQCSLALRRTVR